MKEQTPEERFINAVNKGFVELLELERTIYDEAVGNKVFYEPEGEWELQSTRNVERNTKGIVSRDRFKMEFSMNFQLAHNGKSRTE